MDGSEILRAVKPPSMKRKFTDLENADALALQQKATQYVGRLILLDLFCTSSFEELASIIKSKNLPNVPYLLIVRNYTDRQSLAFAERNGDNASRNGDNASTKSNRSGLKSVRTGSVTMSRFSVNLCAGTASRFKFNRAVVTTTDLVDHFEGKYPLLVATIKAFGQVWAKFIAALYLYEEIHMKQRHFGEVSEIQSVALVVIKELQRQIALTAECSIAERNVIMPWPNTLPYTLSAKLQAEDEDGNLLNFTVNGKPDIYVGPPPPGNCEFIFLVKKNCFLLDICFQN
jgi:hypothetical protein